MFANEDGERCTPAPPDLSAYRVECERIMFEAWARDNRADLTRTSAMATSLPIDYLDGLTAAAWAGWKARATK
jgi:hypothetical protein